MTPTVFGFLIGLAVGFVGGMVLLASVWLIP
jgi:hypothetical protein